VAVKRGEAEMKKKYPIVPIKHPSPDDFEIGRRKVLGLKKKSKERLR